MAENRRKRPRDLAQLAKLIIDIASGQVEDREPTPEERGKDPAAAALGKRGGRARAERCQRSNEAKLLGWLLRLGTPKSADAGQVGSAAALAARAASDATP